MWVFLTNSYLSIVADANSERLLVRARKRGDIERVFPDAVVRRGGGTDYAYRATLDRSDVANVIADVINNAIRYPNFKDAVRAADRHHAYLDVWTVMRRWQERCASGRFDGPRFEDDELPLGHPPAFENQHGEIVEAQRSTTSRKARKPKKGR